MEKALETICSTELHFITVDGGKKKGWEHLADLVDSLKTIIFRHQFALARPHEECLRQLTRFRNRNPDERALANKILDVMKFHYEAKTAENPDEYWSAALADF